MARRFLILTEKRGSIPLDFLFLFPALVIASVSSVVKFCIFFLGFARPSFPFALFSAFILASPLYHTFLFFAISLTKIKIHRQSRWYFLCGHSPLILATLESVPNESLWHKFPIIVALYLFFTYPLLFLLSQFTECLKSYSICGKIFLSFLIEWTSLVVLLLADRISPKKPI